MEGAYRIILGYETNKFNFSLIFLSMPFLKNKVALSAQAKRLEALKPVPSAPSHDVKSPSNVRNAASSRQKEQTKRNSERESQNRPDAKATKTVVKNYGKAMASFAASSLAVPYLSSLLEEEGVRLDDFVRYVSAGKESIEGIDTLRSLILVKENDDEQVAKCKRVFQKVAEIFIKNFSLNWIYGGRMGNKKVHVMFRFKMLRRIQNPELFTYLK